MYVYKHAHMYLYIYIYMAESYLEPLGSLGALAMSNKAKTQLIAKPIKGGLEGYKAPLNGVIRLL